MCDMDAATQPGRMEVSRAILFDPVPPPTKTDPAVPEIIPVAVTSQTDFAPSTESSAKVIEWCFGHRGTGQNEEIELPGIPGEVHRCSGCRISVS